jgi:hypothetical protein
MAGAVVTLTLTIGLVAGVVLVGQDAADGGDDAPTSASQRPITYPPWAFPHRPWVHELLAEGWPVGYHPSLGWQSVDVHGRYVNVSQGVRRSWTDGRGPVVWFLGGSTGYGLGQRDVHTIPSEVARLAAADGTPIRAVNLGVPGYDQWQEVQLMGNRLSRGERPDLIVFYDGNNDLVAMNYRASEGITPLDEPPNRFHQELEPASNYRPEPRGKQASEAELVAAFDRMYGAGIDLARRIAASYGVPVAQYFQPSFASTAPSTHDRELTRAFPELAPGRIDWLRGLEARVRHDLPTGVVDLGAALDRATRPVFFDPIHTNELGAAMIADAMWSTLRGSIARLGHAEAPAS